MPKKSKIEEIEQLLKEKESLLGELKIKSRENRKLQYDYNKLINLILDFFEIVKTDIEKVNNYSARKADLEMFGFIKEVAATKEEQTRVTKIKY